MRHALLIACLVLPWLGAGPTTTFTPGRGLLFDASSTDEVQCGSASDIDDLAVGTILVWIYPNSATADNIIVAKVEAASPYEGLALNVGPSARIRFIIDYSTQDNRYVSANSTVTTSAWQLIVARWNTGGASTDQDGFRGTLTSPPAEMSYLAQNVGTGSRVSDASNNLTIGSLDDGATFGSFDGEIGPIHIIGAYLTDAQIRAQWMDLHPLANTLRLYYPGHNGTTSVPDLGGAAANCTAISGTPTVSNNPPITF